MIVKWITGGMVKNFIERVEVAKESEHFVTLQSGRREAKASDWRSYHDSWQAAHEHLTKLAEAALLSSRRRLERDQAHAGNIRGLKQPEPSNDRPAS